jgi:PKD repeat protein
VHAAPLVSLGVSPSSGNLPLTVTFALGTRVGSITTWRLDFGDGQHTGGGGNPPASVTHTYTKAGTYKPQFAVKPGQYALVYAVTQVTAGGGTLRALSMGATPSSGEHPLTVKFTLTTTIPGQLASWELVFGDGQRTSGSGRAALSVSHTYTKAGAATGRTSSSPSSSSTAASSTRSRVAGSRSPFPRRPRVHAARARTDSRRR